MPKVFDPSKPSCSKNFMGEELSRDDCNMVVTGNKRKLFSSDSAKTSQSLKLHGNTSNSFNNVDPASSSTSKTSSLLIADLSRNEKGSEVDSNSSNLLDPCEENSPIKKLKMQKNKTLQNKRLVEFDKLIEIVLSNIHLKKLLSPEEVTKISNFKIMASNKKYVVLMFYALSNHWCNIYTFCTKVQLDADDKEIFLMFETLQKEGVVEFVDCENHDYNLKDLLQYLSPEQLKILRNKLPFKEQPNVARLKKRNLVTIIAEKFGSKPEPKKLAMKAINEVLGQAARLSKSTYDILNHVYVLSTFTNPEFSNINKYFKYVIDEDGGFPTPSIENCIVFKTGLEFTKYVAALQMQLKLNYEEDDIEITMIAHKAYQELLVDQSQDADGRLLHIQQFTSNWVYCSILSKCCESTFKSGNIKDLSKWLNFLTRSFPHSRQLGMWVLQLIEILNKENKMELAADLLITILSNKEKVFLKEKHLYELSRLGRSLAKSTKRHGNVSVHDLIIKLIQSDIDISQFRRTYIDLPERKSKSRIEEITISNYFNEGYPKFEKIGPVLKALLVIYFWDIIYNPETVITATFINKLQTAPLDLYTFDSTNNCSRFYSMRKGMIDQRIRNIDIGWSEKSFKKFGEDNYQNHLHEMSAAGVIGKIINDFNTFQELVFILGRRILAKIFERLITDLDQYEEGMPDFLFWNINDGTYKFVVSSTVDSLEMLPVPQSLWLDYLVKNQISVEVCTVRGGGTKKKLKGQSSDETENNDNEGPSQSCEKLYSYFGKNLLLSGMHRMFLGSRSF